MSGALVFVQVLNGLQFGVLLFLIAAGLTLVFGVMNFINLAHGVQYMLGAYLAVTFYLMTASFLLAITLQLSISLSGHQEAIRELSEANALLEERVSNLEHQVENRPVDH